MFYNSTLVYGVDIFGTLLEYPSLGWTFAQTYHVASEETPRPIHLTAGSVGQLDT